MNQLRQNGGNVRSCGPNSVSRYRLSSSVPRASPDDSSTDPEDLTDDVIDRLQPDSEPPPEIDVLGISISRAQTLMKSPETPAFEKARVIESSGDYFHYEAIIPGADGGVSEDSTSPPPAGLKPESLKTSPPEVSPPVAQSPVNVHEQPGRSSMIRSILGEMEGNRRRSHSGPTVLGAVKKILPTVPSVPLLGSHQESVSKDSTATPASQTDVKLESLKIKQTPQNTTQAPISPQSPTHTALGLDRNVEPLLSPTSPISNRRVGRSNSETSLYLKRKPTAASTFDDTSAFAEVAEMTNSRLKAITDSFQNSTIRFPKLPTIRYNAKRTSSPAVSSLDDLTTENTQLNSKTNNYYSTNFKNTRSPMMHFELENSQQRAHPVLSEALDRLTGDLVILGGYRGSILRDAKPPHRQLWAPVKVGLNLRSVDLEVGLTRDDEERMHEKIYASGVLSHIGPIDICRRLLKHAKKSSNTRQSKLRVHDYGYDWRLSPELLGQRLIKFLEGLECNSSDTPPEKRGTWVIAHSLGGLITRWAINQRPELFAGVVYAGVPQHCVNILGPLRNGDDVLLSSKVLTAQVNFTLRTSYALLPESGRCFINKHTNERYDLNLFDARTWHDYHLSPCVRPAHSHVRKSIMGSISESISNNLPSLPSMPSIQSVTPKRSSWFGGNSNPVGAPNENNPEYVSEPDPDHHPVPTAVESSLEPTMKANSSSSSSRPSIATACTIPLPIATEYLARTLSEVLAFKRALVHNPEFQSSNRYPGHSIGTSPFLIKHEPGQMGSLTSDLSTLKSLRPPRPSYSGSPLTLHQSYARLAIICSYSLTSIIFGKTVPTVYGARVLSKEHIKYPDAFDDLAFAAGDGVVLASAAQLPDGYRCVKGGRVETDRGHVGLLGDLESVGRCLIAVVEARGRGLGWAVTTVTEDEGKSGYLRRRSW